MGSVYNVKPRFQAALRPVTRWLADHGVTANQVTLSAAALSVAAGTAVYLSHAQRWSLLTIPPVLLVRMALNAIDGLLAREFDQRSSLGAVLNELSDVVSDAALYLPFAVVVGVKAELVVVVVVLAVLTEMAGVVGVQIGASRRYDGPMGKSDRALVFGAVALFLGIGLQAGAWLNIVLAVVVAGLVVTTFNRARSALREVRRV